MAPKQKNPKPNRSPFGLFMYAYEYENSRNSIPIQELVTRANPLWQALTAEQRIPYEQLSQRIRHEYDNRCDKSVIIQEIINSGLVEERGYRGTRNRNTRTSNEHSNCNQTASVASSVVTTIDSRSKRSVASDFDDESDCDLSDEQLIEDAIAKLTTDQKHINIVIISFNVVVVTLDGEYCPNEIGLTMISVTDGIKDKYHKIIYCKVPNGYYGPAKQHADLTHKITLNSDGFAKNYMEIVNEIHAFINRSDLSARTDPKSDAEKKLIFCSPTNKSGINPIPQIVGCLKWLADSALTMHESSVDIITSPENPYSFNDYRVLDLSLLLYAISKPYETFAPRNVFIDDLLKAIYDFNSGISCEFHEHIENRFCALGATIKLAYLFLEPACRYFDIEPTDNHFPLKHSEEITFSSSELKFRPLVKTSRSQRERELDEAESMVPVVPNANRPNRPTLVNHFYIGIGRSRNNKKL